MKSQAAMFVATSIATVAALSIAGTASAKDFGIRVSAYELESSAAANSVYSRIVRTAEQTCADFGRTPIYEKRAQADCIDDVTAEIVASIDHPTLDRVHAGQQQFARR